MKYVIDIKTAYDTAVQKDLFKDAIKENIMDLADADNSEVQEAIKNREVFTDFDSLFNYLYIKYETKAYTALAAADSDLVNQYVIVDYSAMLSDDLLNGYFDIVDRPDGTYLIVKHQR